MIDIIIVSGVEMHINRLMISVENKSQDDNP
jgi:hypothetical protein